MTIRGTTLIGRLAALCTLLFAFTACGGGGGGFLPAEDGPIDPIDLAITTATLPEATAGTPYTALVEAAGGNPPYSWAITNSNSTGLEIDNQGFITGTAPAEGNYPLVIEVEDRSNNKKLLSVILSVIIGPDPLAIATTALPNAIDGILYTAVIEGVGGEKPYIWSVTDGGGTGFGINNEGILSGVAPRSGDYGLSLRLNDNANTQATASFVLTVTGDTPLLPLAIATASLPDAEEGKAYTAILQAEGGQGPYLWSLINSGGSSLQLRDDGVLSGTVLTEGGYAIEVSVTDDARTVSTALILDVLANSSPLTITTSSPLPAGTLDERYAAILNASGGTQSYAWTLVSNGGQSALALSSDGVLSGTPSLAGTFGLVLEVSDGNSTDQLAAALTVTSTPDPTIALTIETTQLPTVDRVLYAATVVAAGGEKPYRWSGRDTSTPASGFIIAADSGVITGNTSNLLPGLYGYNVTVEDADNAITDRSYIIEVPGADNPAVQILTANPLTDAIIGLTYSVVMQAVGGSGSYKWAILQTLKDGMPVATESGPSFELPGSPDSGILFWSAQDVELGDYLITISVTDSDDSADIVVFELSVLLP
jgi:hypothetical protein